MVRANLFHERIDIRVRGRGLRALSPRFWKTIFAAAGAAAVPFKRGKQVNLTALPGGGVAFGENILSLVSSGSFDALAFATAFLEAQPEIRLDSLVYQRLGSAAGERDFRWAILRLRSSFGDRLGPAVVAGTTAVFHPPTKAAKSARRELLRLTASTVWREEKDERLIDALGLTGVFAGSEKVVAEASLPARSFLSVRGDGLLSLQISRAKKKAGTALLCLEFSGTLRLRFENALASLIKSDDLENVSVEILRGSGSRGLPDFGLEGAVWRTSVLGSNDSISLLESGPASASVGA